VSNVGGAASNAQTHAKKWETNT